MARYQLYQQQKQIINIVTENAICLMVVNVLLLNSRNICKDSLFRSMSSTKNNTTCSLCTRTGMYGITDVLVMLYTHSHNHINTHEVAPFKGSIKETSTKL